MYRIRNSEVRLKTSEESLNVSKGLFSIGFKNFVDAAVGPIVLLKSELAR